MYIRELLEYKDITIQCHDNPDVDTIASAYGVYCYLLEHGITSKIIYAGRKITKDNIKLFVELLEIPLENISDNTTKIKGLLVTVDCQYGASNVTKFLADDVVIIDHHQQEVEAVQKAHIFSNYASCATVVWQMMKEDGFDFRDHEKLQTALYYGLYTDSGQFSNISNPVDRDMVDDLKYDHSVITVLQNSNISAKELEIAGMAMLRTIINKELRFAVVKAEECDANILGLISDFVLQVSGIDSCVVFNVSSDGIKFSTRSCTQNIKANHLASVMARGIGSGGGHKNKAGGFISMKCYEEKNRETEVVTFFSNKMHHYMTDYETIDVKKYTYDIASAKKYCKKKLKLGYVVVPDFIPVGTEITVRTLEGDLHFKVEENTYVMIDFEGEIHPISKEKFEASYIRTDEPYTAHLTYHPRAKIQKSDTEYNLLDYVKSCETTGKNYVYAKQLESKGAKVFTEWDRHGYMLGEIGDYLVARCDDPKDVYIIADKIFQETYSEV